MKRTLLILSIILATVFTANAQISDVYLNLAEDSLVDESKLSGEELWKYATLDRILDQGVQREYWLYIPSKLKVHSFVIKNTPLVIALHGYDGKAYKYFPELLEAARDYGFALCIPVGIMDREGKTGWNVGYPSQRGMRVDDGRFLMNLTRMLQDDMGFSKSSTFCTGMSNGGDMCYMLSRRYPNIFKAFASMCGTLMTDISERYALSKPVNFMEIHGTDDQLARWAGDPDNKLGWGSYMSVPQAIDELKTISGCIMTDIHELEPYKKDSKLVIVHSYTGGKSGTEVVLYEVVNGVHSYFKDDLDAPGKIMSFFKSHCSPDALEVMQTIF